MVLDLWCECDGCNEKCIRLDEVYKDPKLIIILMETISTKSTPEYIKNMDNPEYNVSRIVEAILYSKAIHDEHVLCNSCIARDVIDKLHLTKDQEFIETMESITSFYFLVKKNPKKSKESTDWFKGSNTNHKVIIPFDIKDIHKMFPDLIDSEKGRRTLGIIPSFITVADEVAYGHNFEIGNMERIDPE